MRLLVGLTFAIAGLFACAQAEPTNAGAPVAIDGPEEIVIPSEAFACSPHTSNADGPGAADIPDAPPRFVRLPGDTIMMSAGHHNNIPWYTKDGVSFKRQGCGSILRSGLNPDPAAFDNHAWIVGFYTKNRTDIFALVHNEYHGASVIPACRKRLRPGQAPWEAICLQISMRGYVSHDAGRNFQPLAVDSPVLATTNDVITPGDEATITRVGIHDPSNIVQNPADKAFYFISLVDPSPNQPRGTCLFRSTDPLTQPWYAWDGTGFSSRMGSPYAGKGARCAPVRPWGTYIPAISWNTKLKKFLAIGRTDQHELVAITSPDLIHWDRNIVLRPSVQSNWWRPFSGDPAPDAYYSLFDSAPGSLFFDTTGSSPYLYYVRWRTGPLAIKSRERDIVRVKLRVGA